MEIFLEVLNHDQQQILPNFEFLKAYKFYLAGGTALALQIRHRTSVDFDFYTDKEFNPQTVYKQFQKQNNKKILLSSVNEDNTLILEINNISVSLFNYPYILARGLLESRYIDLASLEDIAAMKMIAIIQRGAKRDFIDMYFLIRKLGLEKIFKISKEKYPGFNEYLALQSLTYFEDAETKKDERDIKLFDTFSWNEAKDFFFRESGRMLKIWRQDK